MGCLQDVMGSPLPPPQSEITGAKDILLQFEESAKKFNSYKRQPALKDPVLGISLPVLQGLVAALGKKATAREIFAKFTSEGTQALAFQISDGIIPSELEGKDINSEDAGEATHYLCLARDTPLSKSINTLIQMVDDIEYECYFFVPELSIGSKQAAAGGPRLVKKHAEAMLRFGGEAVLAHANWQESLAVGCEECRWDMFCCKVAQLPLSILVSQKDESTFTDDLLNNWDSIVDNLLRPYGNKSGDDENEDDESLSLIGSEVKSTVGNEMISTICQAAVAGWLQSRAKDIVKAEMKAITSKGDTAASERLGNLHFVNGDLSLRKGKAKQATVFYKQAVEAFEAALGKTHAKTLTAKLLYAQTATNDESANMAGEVGKSAPSDSSLQLLGTATEAGLRWNKGDKEKARASFASLSGKTDVFHEAALSAQRRGRVQAAMLYFRAAIETAADDANKFEYTAELAALHYSTDELDKAVSYFNEVADYQKAQSTTSVEYLKACNNVVDALRIQGKTEEALKIAQQSIKACEQNAGKNSLAILVAYNNVARLKRDSGNTNGAIKDYTRVLEIKEKRLGSLHFDTLTSYNNLAALHQKVGHLDVAEEMFRTSCEGCESTMGKYDKASLNVKGNLGIVLLEQGNIDAGVTLINESLLYFHRVHSLPNEHRWVQKFMRALHASGNVDQDPSPTSLKFAQSTMPAQTQLSIKASELR